MLWTRNLKPYLNEFCVCRQGLVEVEGGICVPPSEANCAGGGRDPVGNCICPAAKRKTSEGCVLRCQGVGNASKAGMSGDPIPSAPETFDTFEKCEFDDQSARECATDLAQACFEQNRCVEYSAPACQNNGVVYCCTVIGTPVPTPAGGPPSTAAWRAGNKDLLSWTAVPNATSYNIYKDGDLFRTLTETSITRPVSRCELAYFTVEACNTIGCGPISGRLRVDGTPPGQPPCY